MQRGTWQAPSWNCRRHMVFSDRSEHFATRSLYHFSIRELCMCEPNNNVSENQDQTQTPTPPVAEDDAMSTRHSTDQTQPATKTAAVDDRLWGELEKYGLSTVEVRGSGSGDSGDV